VTTDHPFSLFISSKMTELADERRAVQAALSQLPKFCCWLWEDNAGARPEPIRSTYLAEVEACDVYIGLFWKEYGSYTIEEFNHARLQHKPCLIYEKYVDVDQRTPHLSEFLESIQQMEAPDGLAVCRFTTPEALAEQVKNDVLRLLFTTLRQKYALLQKQGLGGGDRDVRGQNIHSQAAILERYPSLLVKVRPVPNGPNLVRIEACFLGEQKEYQKWLHVDEQPRKLETVSELLSKLTDQCHRYIQNPQHTLIVEIFLPVPWLNYNVDEWMINAGLKQMVSISTYYPVVLRSLDRIESGDTHGAQRMRNAWERSWERFEQQLAVPNLYFLQRQDCQREILLELLDVACIAFMFTPPKVVDENIHIFSTMISAGVPIAFWPRLHDKDLSELEISHVYNSFLSDCDLSKLPTEIWEKKKCKRQDEHPLLRHLVLLWDNPNRLPRKGRRRAAAPIKKGSA
jgi:hypothetical protein